MSETTRLLTQQLRSLSINSRSGPASRLSSHTLTHRTTSPWSLRMSRDSRIVFSSKRCFSTSHARHNWLEPKRAEKSKSRVGRPRMPTGGSMRGTTVVWGDFGLRMRDHDRRVSAKQLRIGEQAIKNRLRGMNYQLYTKVSANIGVYTKGNEVRMGKGKGKFDYWAARIPVSRIIFELKGDIHEKVVRDAFRLAGHKLPGLYEFVRKGDPPMVGITKLGGGVTLESLKEARRPVESKDMENQPIIPAMTTEPPQTISTSM